MSQQFISKECSLFLTNSNIQTIVQYETLSAIGTNRFGEFNECLTNDNNSYYLIRVLLNKTTELISGICFNSNCTEADLRYIFRTFQSYVPVSSELEDVILHTKQEIKIDGLFLCFTIFLLLLGLIVIFATCMDWQKCKGESLVVRIFSISKLLQLLTIRQPKLMIMYGLRFLMFIGIIIIHQIVIMADLPILSLSLPKHSFFSLTYILIYCIDIWFLISGFFLSYTLLQQFSLHKSIKTHLMSTIMRIMITWPVYIAGLLITWLFVPNVGYGPIYPLLSKEVKTRCSSMFLYDSILVSNFMNNSCNPTLWYYQAQIQLTLIFTLLLLLYLKSNDKRGLWVFYVLQIIMMVCSFIYPLLNIEEIKVRQYIKNVNSGYWKTPLSRVCGYIIGFNLGIMYYRFKKVKKENLQQTITLKLLNHPVMKNILAIFPVFIILGIEIMLYFYENDTIPYNNQMILIIGHLLVPFSISLLILRPLFGFQNTLKNLLSIKTFTYLSRILMSAYIIHHAIQVQELYSTTTDLYANGFIPLFSAICSIPHTLVFGLLLALLMQLPLSLIRNHYFPHYYSYL